MADSVAELERLRERFGQVSGLRFEAGPGGLLQAVVANDHAEARVFLHGAHLSHFQPRGQKPLLWMSRANRYEPGKPIRGGVPICWPWFGPHPQDATQPAHGFVRKQVWDLREASQESSGATRLTFALGATAATRARWPHEFELEFSAVIGPRLEMRLRTRNAGPAPFTFEEALHTYFTVSDIRKVAVRGLAGATYLDKVHNLARHVQQTEEITFTSETDRVYLDTTAACEVSDPGLGRRILVEKEGSRATVVWNPWIKKAAAMPDFGDDEWPEMVCVETANVAEHAVTLVPGTVHEVRARVSVSA